MKLLDLFLETNPSRFALNKRWGPGKQLNRSWFEDKKTLRQEMRDKRLGYAQEGQRIRAGIFFSSGCDIDAPLKLVLDAAQTAVYADDKQVADMLVHVERDNDPWILIVFETLCPRISSAVFDAHKLFSD